MKTLAAVKRGLWLAVGLVVVPGSSFAAVVRIPATAPIAPVSVSAGSRALPPLGAFAGLSMAPSLSASPTLPIPAPAPALGTVHVAASMSAPASSAARPQASAQTPEGDLSGVRSAPPAAAVQALTEALQHADARKGASRPDKLDVFFDGSAPMVKPAVDWWEVAGQRYESTAQLVRALPRLGKAREATYHYRHKNVVDSNERRFNTAAGGVAAALIGVAGGALLWALGAAVGPFIGLAGGLTASAAPDLLLFSGFFGAALGACGLLIGALEGGKPAVNAVMGKLHVSGRNLRLIVKGEDGKTSAVVNLNAYAQAQTPRTAPMPAPQTALLGAMKGLGLGLAVAVSMMIPIVMAVTIPLMGPAVAWDVGRRLSRRSHAVGGLLGGALGLLVPLSFFAALSVGGAQNIALMAVWAGALGLVGAVLGALLNNPLNRADAWAKVYAPQGQWWNRSKA